MTPAKFPAAQASVLHDQAHRAGLDPRTVIRATGVRAKETILDVGAGSGFFTLALSDAVGPEGRVIAADVSPEMLDELRRRASDEGRENIRVVPSEEQVVPLADASVDRAFLVDVLHEAEDPLTILRESSRVVRRGGEIVVIDWEVGEGPPGPPAAERLGSARLAGLLKTVGLPYGDPLEGIAAPHFGVRVMLPMDRPLEPVGRIE